MPDVRGLPLLSGPPPELRDTRAEVSCRKCNKEFNLFTRSQKCNHCGYLYCGSCSDYQALMPRGDPATGYDPKNVCAFCIQYLQITAAGKGFLRSQSLSKLKNYIQAYNIKLGANILEKEDLINAIVLARNPNGCLPKVNENWYRKHAVPNGQTSRPRGLFSRGDGQRQPPRQNFATQAPWTQGGNEFSRPDLLDDEPGQQQRENNNMNSPSWTQTQANGRQQSQPSSGPTSRPTTQQPFSPPPGPPPGYSRNNSSPPQRPVPPQTRNSGYTSSRPIPPARPTSHTGASNGQSFPPNQGQQSSRARTTSQPASSTTTTPPRPPSTSSASFVPKPPPKVPSLDDLLQIPEEDISTFTISQLKEILVSNHVSAPRMILEKSELVDRVLQLVTTERREREHMQAVREREEWEEQERAWAARERERKAREAREKEEREREERERRQHQGAYRTTVEDASESDDSLHRVQEPESTTRTDSILSSDRIDNSQSNAQPSPPGHTSPPSPTAEVDEEPDPPLPPRPGTERSGLCVVCQDEDANMVIIDCGHLALCRGCADLVWKSTRECPLCRTRIVTEQRFLRVFRA